MADLYLVRGLPGAGKTTFAKKLIKELKHVEEIINDIVESDSSNEITWYEADHFFEYNNQYNYNKDEIRLAHVYCLSNAVLSLRKGNDVIVSNTFTTFDEIKKYIDYLKNDDTLFVFDIEQQFESVHNVPEETLQKMRNRYLHVNDLALELKKIKTLNSEVYSYDTIANKYTRVY